MAAEVSPYSLVRAVMVNSLTLVVVNMRTCVAILTRLNSEDAVAAAAAAAAATTAAAAVAAV